MTRELGRRPAPRRPRPRPTGRADRGRRPSDAPDAAGRPAATTSASPARRSRTPSPFCIGFFGGLGAVRGLLAAASRCVSISSVLILIVVALFLAAGLNPVGGVLRAARAAPRLRRALRHRRRAGRAGAVRRRDRPGHHRPGRLDQRRTPRSGSTSSSATGRSRSLDEKYDVIDKVKDYVANGDFVGSVFGGVLGVGLAVLGALATRSSSLVLTLYFLSSLDKTKQRALPAGPGLAPRPGHQARRPDHRERRRLRLRRVRRGDVRRHLVAGLPVRRRPRRVRRRAGLRGRAARRDPDDRRHDRRRDRDRDRLRRPTRRSASPA